ncbi:MAG: amino acid ABC transporter permease [Chloroflexota bacterium]|nr:amino acid ABC transporter permease [Chloroflexota bacterium]
MTTEAKRARQGRLLPVPIPWGQVPWWAIILAIVGVTVGWSVLTSETYLRVIRFVLSGVRLTLQVTVISYLIALVVGLIFGLMRVSDNPVSYAVSTLYVEVMRGVPLLVTILYMGYVITPKLRDATGGQIDLQGVPAAVLALAVCYGAYEAEVYRGGIESIERGQMEAARSLGMTYMQAMRCVILPQAIRRILPPLGNDFISMLKDSSLIAVIALPDLLQMGRLFVSRTFRAFEGYNTVALLYLVMTLVLSLVVRVIERRAAIE